MADDQFPVLPPTNPVMPNLVPPSPAQPTYTGDQNDLLTSQLISASQLGQSTFADQLARMHQLASTVAELQQQKAAMPQPKRSLADEPWMKMQPITGQGFGHDVANLGKDVGRGLLLGLSSTSPGQSIQDTAYGPGVSRYNVGQRNLAERIAELQGQQKTEEEVMPSAAGLQYHPFTAAGSMMRGQAELKKAESYGQSVANHLTVALKGLDLKAIEVGSQVEVNKAKAALDRAMPGILQERNALISQGIDVGAATRQAVENAQAQLGIDERHPLSLMIDTYFGTDLTPKAATIPTAVQPQRSTAAKKPTTKPTGGTIYARDPQGKLHQAPAGTALPQGWTIEQRK